MFAYCGNNPVFGYDPMGCYRASVLGDKEYVSKRYPPEPTSTPEYIYDQDNLKYKNLYYGISTVGHGGCGPVATYNAAIELGMDVTFDDILRYFEDHDLLILGGLLGTKPNAPVQFFRDNGYAVICVDDVASYSDFANSADASILWMFYVTDSRPYFGAHFVAFTQTGDTGYYYNAYSEWDQIWEHNGDCYSFAQSYGSISNILYCIYKV